MTLHDYLQLNIDIQKTRLVGNKTAFSAYIYVRNIFIYSLAAGALSISLYFTGSFRIFDYATQYCLKHPTIVAPEEFEVTDADYNDLEVVTFIVPP